MSEDLDRLAAEGDEQAIELLAKRRLQAALKHAPVPVPAPVPADPVSAARKEQPLFSGPLSYFPDALLEISRLCHAGNEKHNPGEPLHWARSKSTDHADCLARHLLSHGTVDPENGLSHTVMVAWRALAMLQLELEAARGLPISRGSRK